ncbi:MAG: L-fucose mutarotase [Planctomycetota bacterium]|jgi:L-fucose mutarotase
MLKGISPLLSPKLLAALCRMGHGDEIILADAHYPAHSSGIQVLRADGTQVEPLLRAILPLFALDTPPYVPTPVTMMGPEPGDAIDPAVEASYRAALDELAPGTPDFGLIERKDFYEHAKGVFIIVQTSDTRRYANLILRKGVSTPP